MAKKEKPNEINWIYFYSSTKQRLKINYIKAKIDNTQQNSKFELCGDSDETVNDVINECSKLAQKEYQTRHDWVGKVIYWKLCNRLNFG